MELPCPFTLQVDRIDRFLNAELVDDPHYSGIEVQWFDDEAHGRGLLVFLERRADRRVDYHHTPGLRLDPALYVLGAGTGSWREVVFDPGVLEVTAEGVRCEIGFDDADGRRIEVAIDDRRAGSRRTGSLLAPVGSAIDAPVSLALVHLDGFDLVRRSDPPPRIAIAGREAATGTLPAGRLHGRELIKYAAPLTVVSLNRAVEGPLPSVTVGQDPTSVADGPVARTVPGVRSGTHAIVELGSGDGDDRTRLQLTPGLPDVTALTDGETHAGRWRVRRGTLPPLTGGSWQLRRTGEQVDLELAVTDRWRPGPLPPLVRTVTTLVPVFRRWPTTYRWHATVTLGADPQLSSGWERTAERDRSYGRATGNR